MRRIVIFSSLFLLVFILNTLPDGDSNTHIIGSIGELWFSGQDGSSWSYKDGTGTMLDIQKHSQTISGKGYTVVGNGKLVSMFFGSEWEQETEFGGYNGELNPLVTFRKEPVKNRLDQNDFKIFGYMGDYNKYMSSKTRNIKINENECLLYNGGDTYTWQVCSFDATDDDGKIYEDWISGSWGIDTSDDGENHYWIIRYTLGSKLLWRVTLDDDGGIVKMESGSYLMDLTGYKLANETSKPREVLSKGKTATTWGNIKLLQ